MSEESHEYDVRIDWKHDRIGNMFIQGKPVVEVATPPEFDGHEGIISPEDLFVASAASCLMTTFIAFTKKMRIDFKSFSCEAKGKLEKVEKGFQFTHILIKTTVAVESDELKGKAERALELAGKYCLVSNSMKCTTDHENTVIIIK